MEEHAYPLKTFPGATVKIPSSDSRRKSFRFEIEPGTSELPYPIELRLTTIYGKTRLTEFTVRSHEGVDIVKATRIPLSKVVNELAALVVSETKKIEPWMGPQARPLSGNRQRLRRRAHRATGITRPVRQRPSPPRRGRREVHDQDHLDVDQRGPQTGPTRPERRA